MKTTDRKHGKVGYDAPVESLRDDHLGRWAFAREIYDVASAGRSKWSVRIGVYGEWGTGKTSVLKFIATMADRDQHIVVWFNPWQHRRREDMWRDFVLTVYSQLESKLSQVPGAGRVNRKKLLSTVKGIVTSATKAWNKSAGEAVHEGLSLLKQQFTFTSSDFKPLEPILRETRIIVLIDDLDRAASELVPEILFVLKELLDIPNFSFVCAFDPVVVGKVLRSHNPGFDDGLKFLDKIIDFPRWLPPPSHDALLALALLDAKTHCENVPRSAVRESLSLLPANPRTIRQFIRLLAMLQRQVHRHYDHELCWPAVIAATALKIRHPQIAFDLLENASFWRRLGILDLSRDDGTEDEKKQEAIDEEIAKTCKAIGLELSTVQENEVKASMRTLSSQMGLFGDNVAYQFHIAETPAAVTQKEFDQFLQRWRMKQERETVSKWMKRQSSKFHQSNTAVFRGLTRYAVAGYRNSLSKADGVSMESERPTHLDAAKSLLSLLNCLLFELAKISDEKKMIGESELELLTDTFAQFAGTNLPTYEEFRSQNESLILSVFREWGPDQKPLVKLLSPFAGARLRNFESVGAGKLHEKLCEIAMPRYGRALIDRFSEFRFIRELIPEDSAEFNDRMLIIAPTSPIWGALRSEMLDALGRSLTSRTVQENAFELLHLFAIGRQGSWTDANRMMKELFADQEIFSSVWKAATASQLSPRAVYQIRMIPKTVADLGVQCDLPVWWNEIASTFAVPARAACESQ